MFRRMFAAFRLGGRPLQKAQFSRGDILSVVAEQGRFAVVKLLAVDQLGVHVRLYTERFANRPSHVDLTKLTLAPFGPGHDQPFSIGHMPLTHSAFQKWKPELILTGQGVGHDELEGYNMWLEAEASYFDEESL